MKKNIFIGPEIGITIWPMATPVSSTPVTLPSSERAYADAARKKADAYGEEERQRRILPEYGYKPIYHD